VVAGKVELQRWDLTRRIVFEINDDLDHLRLAIGNSIQCLMSIRHYTTHLRKLGRGGIFNARACNH
jgi:hypothetical protein